MKALTGECITLAVKPSDTIKHVKALLGNQTHVPPKVQGLIDAKKELFWDDMPLHEYGVRNESTLHLGIRIPYPPYIHASLPLIIMAMNGQYMFFYADFRTDPLVDDVKTYIYVETAIPKTLQILTYKRFVMEDKAPLSVYGIRPANIIDLFVDIPVGYNKTTKLAYQALNGKLPKRIAVCVKTITKTKFWVTKDSKIEKDRMGRSLSITATEMEGGETEFNQCHLTRSRVSEGQSGVYVDLRATASGLNFPITVNPWNKLSEIKAMISCEHAHGVLATKTRFMYRGVVLTNNDDGAAADINIENNSTILVTTPPPRGSMRIFIVEMGTWETYMLSVDSSDTIRHTKQQIEEHFCIPAIQQKLEYNGQVVENHKTVFDYKIQHESALNLYKDSTNMHSTTFYFNTNRGDFLLMAEDTDSIRDVKARILVRRHEHIDFLKEQDSLDQCQTDNRCAIVSFRQFEDALPIYIETPTLQKLTVDAFATDNIKHIMERLFNKWHLPGT